MTRFLSIVSLIIPLALAADAPSDAPFKYPPAQQAWKRYQLRTEQVRREFDQRMKEARERYVSDLDDAARKAAVDGNMDAVKEIAEGKAGITGIDTSNGPVDVVFKHYKFTLKPDGVVTPSWFAGDGRWWVRPDGLIAASMARTTHPNWLLIPMDGKVVMFIRYNDDAASAEFWRKADQ